MDKNNKKILESKRIIKEEKKKNKENIEKIKIKTEKQDKYILPNISLLNKNNNKNKISINNISR